MLGHGKPERSSSEGRGAVGRPWLTIEAVPKAMD
jgi:hypothetical protein